MEDNLIIITPYFQNLQIAVCEDTVQSYSPAQRGTQRVWSNELQVNGQREQG